MPAKKKPAWPVDFYEGTCTHVELVATISPTTARPVDVGVDLDEVLVGFRDLDEVVVLNRAEVRELIAALTEAHARSVQATKGKR